MPKQDQEDWTNEKELGDVIRREQFAAATRKINANGDPDPSEPDTDSLPTCTALLQVSIACSPLACAIARF
jgi:hypothetical protein